MAQAGLLALTRIAPQAWQAALPSYRSRFSKHHFAQPQLLATLGRMRYED